MWESLIVVIVMKDFSNFAVSFFAGSAAFAGATSVVVAVSTLVSSFLLML